MKLRIALVASVALSLTACGQARQTPQSGSSVLDVSSFDAQNFNAGNTYEHLVNPLFARDGEHSLEQVDAATKPWLKSLDERSEARENGNFLQMQQRMSPAQVSESNDALKAMLAREGASEIGFTKDEAGKLLGLLTSQRQVRDHGHYDPQWSIGFCFGRAMIVHSFAKNSFVMENGQKVDKKTIPVRKIWVTGAMSPWKHHVATMVMAKEAGVGFWVVDNFVGRVVSAADWMAHLQRQFPQANVLFNVSRANRFSEANALRYYEVLLDDPFFNGFFRDFLTTNVPAINRDGGVDISPAAAPAPARSPNVTPGGNVPEEIATTPAA